MLTPCTLISLKPMLINLQNNYLFIILIYPFSEFKPEFTYQQKSAILMKNDWPVTFVTFVEAFMENY